VEGALDICGYWFGPDEGDLSLGSLTWDDSLPDESADDFQDARDDYANAGLDYIDIDLGDGGFAYSVPGDEAGGEDPLVGAEALVGDLILSVYLFVDRFPSEDAQEARDAAVSLLREAVRAAQ